MRIYFKIFLCCCFTYVFLSSASAFQQQGFTSYQEWYGNKIDFSCESQCVIVVDKLWGSDYLQINGQTQWNGTIGYGFLVGEQIAPGETMQINWWGVLDQKFNFSNNPYRDQIPKDASVVLIVQGKVKGSGVGVSVGFFSFFEKFWNGFKQALEYKEYNPRTINFLEGPMWNGEYINKYFFPWIIRLLVFVVIGYYLSTKKNNKEKAVLFGIGVLVFFRVFFDFFSTVNQVKIYKQVMSATNIMENGRVGRSSDFYPFLEWIKTQVPKKEKWFFIAPYPFDFEGKYHIYPDVKFDVITWVNYLFVYNPYGPNNPFDFKDPVYSGWMLFWEDVQFSISKEIIWNDHAKIYLLKNK